jgi:hypothetical protein
MDATQEQVRTARMNYRAAEIRGHGPGCAVAWDGRQCSCGGRARWRGAYGAERLERVQDERRRYLFSIDPLAAVWVATGGKDS